MSIFMPDLYEDRVEWSSDGPSWAKEDRKRINAIIRKAMIDEAITYRDIYDDCGELNSTKLAEDFCNENELNIYDETGQPHTPCDLFEIAQEIEKEVIKKWDRMNEDENDSD
jgi:hypothetical protein